MSAAADKFLSQTAKVDPDSVQPFPNSSKVYEQGSRADIQVPMREIRLADTHTSDGIQHNAPVYVYDTSGPYTDPSADIDVRKGLPALRADWIAARGDTEALDGLSSDYGRERLDDANLAALRFVHTRNPLRARDGANVTQMHYARRGIVTPEMEYIAIRENMRRKEHHGEELQRRHPGMSFGAKLPEEVTPEFVRDGSGGRARHHSLQRQSPGNRADDHRA